METPLESKTASAQEPASEVQGHAPALEAEQPKERKQNKKKKKKKNEKSSSW